MIIIYDSPSVLAWSLFQRNNFASNSHCFGHTDSRAGSPWNFKRVYARVHRRKSRQNYHRPPQNYSEFLVWFLCEVSLLLEVLVLTGKAPPQGSTFSL